MFIGLEEKRQRLQNMSYFENELRSKGCKFIAGVDEVGRGPLAGPVVAVACILKEGIEILDINDSKKLTPAKRKAVYTLLVNSREVIYSVGIIDEKTIDNVNILQATFLAMQKAVFSLPVIPEVILVDGHLQPDFNGVKSKCIVRGDSLSVSIAAASIIAKVIRDEMMDIYHEKWPHYGFKNHKGYGTKLHISALKAYGPCDIHRRSFDPIKSMDKDF